MSVKDLGKRFTAFRELHGYSLRDVAGMVEINNPTLCRIGQGKPVDYDTGKKLEKFLGDFKEPRQWELVSSYKKGHLYFGVISGPSPAAGKTIKVREILSQPTKSAVKDSEDK